MTDAANDMDQHALAIGVFQRLSGLKSSDPYERIRSVAEKLREARLCFSNIGNPDQAMIFALGGAQNVLTAALEMVGIGDLPTCFPDECADISAMVFSGCPIVSEAVSPRIAPEKVYFGLACVNALLTRRNDPLRNDRLNYAGLFVAELSTQIYVRALNKRGHQLLRDFAIRRAAECEFDQTSMFVQ